MGKFQIKIQANDTYRFMMKAGNGQTILTGEACKTKDACLCAIELLREQAMIKERFELKKSFNLKHYFNVLDSKGQVIGSSEMYESSSGRDVGIALVKSNAPDAIIEDLA